MLFFAVYVDFGFSILVEIVIVDGRSHASWRLTAVVLAKITLHSFTSESRDESDQAVVRSILLYGCKPLIKGL